MRRVAAAERGTHAPAAGLLAAAALAVRATASHRGGMGVAVGRVALWAAVALLAAGCAPEQRYRTLSFFFDGVPRPGEEVAEAADAPPRTDFAAGYQARREARLAAEAGQAQRLKAYAHGPYASKNCSACHATGAAAAEMFIPGQGGRGHMAAFGPALRLPRNQICGYCHTEFRPEELTATYRYTHGPVAAGACLNCHSPHVTPNPFMVLKSPIRALCLDCHQDADIYRQPYHSREQERDCTDCHSPHGGDRQYFLRPGVVSPPPAEGGPEGPDPSPEPAPGLPSGGARGDAGEASG